MPQDQDGHVPVQLQLEIEFRRPVDGAFEDLTRVQGDPDRFLILDRREVGLLALRRFVGGLLLDVRHERIALDVLGQQPVDAGVVDEGGVDLLQVAQPAAAQDQGVELADLEHLAQHDALVERAEGHHVFFLLGREQPAHPQVENGALQALGVIHGPLFLQDHLGRVVGNVVLPGQGLDRIFVNFSHWSPRRDWNLRQQTAVQMEMSDSNSGICSFS